VGGTGRTWEGLEGRGRDWKDVGGTGTTWEGLEGRGRDWKDVGETGRTEKRKGEEKESVWKKTKHLDSRTWIRLPMTDRDVEI